MRERRADNVAMPDFSQHLSELLSTKEGQQSANKLIELVCEILDQAISEGGVYLTIGTNRSQKKAMITLTEGTNKLYAVGASLEELIADLESF